MFATALTSAADAARHAAMTGEFEMLLTAEESGMSANFCHALADFVDGETVLDLEAPVRSSGSRPLPGIGRVTRRISRDSADILREAALLIRATAPPEDFSVVGPVVRLESPAPEAGGVAHLATEVDGRPRSIRIEMNAEDYRLAVDSHDGRQTLLSCEGELTFSGGTAHLEHVRDVEVVRVFED